MQPMHSREMFHSKNQTQPQPKKRNIFVVPPQTETFLTKLPVAQKRKRTTTQGRKGNRTHLSHTRRERRTSDTFVLRSKHQCRMKRILYLYINMEPWKKTHSRILASAKDRILLSSRNKSTT